MSTLDATPEPLNDPPRVLLELDMSSLTPDPTEATILRHDPDGRQRAVRPAEPATLVAGVWAGYDYESPFGQSVTYTASSVTPAGTVTSSSVTLAVDEVWLRHPGVPSLSLVVTVAGKESDRRPVERGVFSVLGRSTPVVVSGTRKAASSALQLTTLTLEEEVALLALLDASVLLLSEPESTRWGLGHFYLSPGDVEVARVGPGEFEERIVSFPYDTVDRPAGGLQAQFTYADLLADHSTYADVYDRYDDYADVLANARNDV